MAVKKATKPVKKPVPVLTNNDESKVTLVTKEGYKALQDELHHLETVRRKEIASRIKEAVSYGDLSENSEYEEAKNEQAFLEGRIIILTEQLKYAKIIESDSAKNSAIVQLGNKVKIKAVSGKLQGETMEYTIVGTTEADPMNQKISNESPVGSALLGRSVGEIVEVNAPLGVVSYEILKLS